MTDTDALPDPHIEPPEGPLPASEAMAERLRVNRTGHLTPAQHRLVWIVGIGALVFMLCPLGLVLQMLVVILAGETPTVTLGGLVFTAVGAGFVVLILGLVGTNVVAFLGEALSPHPVRSAQGPLQIHVSSKKRPELPFSYIIGDYSFAPYLAPRDLPMRTDAPYVVYYGTKTRLLLSIAALDAPDADEWSPQFDQE
jgi:hypothetical protein